MVEKYGRQNGVQRYRCTACGRFFRATRTRNGRLWADYTFRRQTVRDLSRTTGFSTRQIRRKLAAATHETHIPLPPARPVVIVLDTTYFDAYGVMVFRDPHARTNVLWYFVAEETNALYLQGLEELRRRGYAIAAVVCDGKKWLCESIVRLYPVQHCQFHLLKTVTRHLTRRPVLPAGQELRRLALTLSRTTEEVFAASLNAWHERWRVFLAERTTDPLTRRWHYTHRRIRSAYGAMRHTLPYLFTYEHHPDLHIPKTTNTLDGSFSQLKQKIHVHRGLNTTTQQKMVETILMGQKFKKTN